MKSKRISITLLGVIGIYFLSYYSIKFAKPESINSNDGPHVVYNSVYFPLRYLDTKKPDYYTHSLLQNPKVKIEWINLGNGYLYFEWEGRETRAGMACETLGFTEGDTVYLNIEYDLLTYDDFTNHLIPYIVEIQKV